MLSAIARLATYIGTCRGGAGPAPQDARDARARSACRAGPSSRSRRWHLPAVPLGRREEESRSPAAIALAVGAVDLLSARGRGRRTPLRRRNDMRRSRWPLVGRPRGRSPPLASAQTPRRRRRRRRRRSRCCAPRGCSTGRSDATVANAVVVVEGSKIMAAGAGPRRAGRRDGRSISATRRSCPGSSTPTRT